MTATTTVEVHPGVCGFVARIEAGSEDQQHVSFRLHSDCENIRALAAHDCRRWTASGDAFIRPSGRP